MLHSAYPMLKLLCRRLGAGIFLLLVSPYALSQDFSSAASQFASKISSRNTPDAVSLSIRNRSSLNDSVVSLLEGELQHQLLTRGWRLKKAEETDNSMLVTLGENLSSYVWTAQISGADATDAVLFELPRPKEEANAARGLVPLSRALLIASDTPMLDVTLLEGKIAEGMHLLALTPTVVQLYQLQSSQWRLMQTQSLGTSSLSNRDLRGRITPGQGNSFDAYLPGMHCTGTVTASVTVSCRDSDDPWPLTDDRRLLGFYAAHRDYFNGVITGATPIAENLTPFYSLASLSDRVIYTGVDGRVHVASSSPRSSSFSETWGSEIASVQSSCQSEMILATANGDLNQSDSVTAYRSSGTDFSAVSEPISFSGPVMSLKTSGDHQQAIAIVASLSGGYEAYLLSARCGA